MTAARPPATPARHSVFFKLLAIMVVTTASLLVLVLLFFSLLVSPKMVVPVARVADGFAHRIADTAPDFEHAKAISAQLGFEVRYEGPAGAWTTSSKVPTPTDLDDRGARHRGLGQIIQTAAPDGGRYVFVWQYPRQMTVVHNVLAALLSIFIAAVTLSTYLVLRRLLRPLRWLGEGVARVGAGELDVEVPVATRDELGTLTAAFNQMVRRVGEMVRARDRLLRDISHELRSPLTRLRLAVELEAESTRRTRMIADLAEMDGMISELLELERLREGPAPRRERHDLAALVRDVAAAFQDRSPGVRVEAPPALEAAIDADKLRTVARNLIENALKHSLADSRPVEVTVAREGDLVRLQVDDDGTGIPEADLPSIFDPFFRVDSSRSRATGGYGLGLSICKRVVEAHGGSLDAANRPGRGARFTATFPASAPSPRP